MLYTTCNKNRLHAVSVALDEPEKRVKNKNQQQQQYWNMYSTSAVNWIMQIGSWWVSPKGSIQQKRSI